MSLQNVIDLIKHNGAGLICLAVIITIFWQMIQSKLKEDATIRFQLAELSNKLEQTNNRIDKQEQQLKESLDLICEAIKENNQTNQTLKEILIRLEAKEDARNNARNDK